MSREVYAPPQLCAPLPPLKDRQKTRSSILDSDKVPGTLTGSLEGHQAFPQATERQKAVELPKWPFEPVQTSLPWAKSHPTAHQSLICPSGQVIYYGSETGLEKNNLL